MQLKNSDLQAIGLSVEFISHVVFTFSQKTHLSRKQRVIDSMGTMGPAVSLNSTFCTAIEVLKCHNEGFKLILAFCRMCEFFCAIFFRFRLYYPAIFSCSTLKITTSSLNFKQNMQYLFLLKMLNLITLFK